MKHNPWIEYERDTLIPGWREHVTKPKPSTNEARREREAVLRGLTQLPEWALVTRGLNQYRDWIQTTVVVGEGATEVELRAWQARYRLLSEFLRDPVAFLTQFDDRE